jgi:hypothetical protein
MATRSTQRLPRCGASHRRSPVGAPRVYERPAVEGAVSSKFADEAALGLGGLSRLLHAARGRSHLL